MGLKKTERVIYEKNPLVEVVCQVRFYPVLELQTQPPVSLQKALTSEYPKIQIENPSLISFGPFVTGGIDQGQNLYHFTSPDDKWRLSVCGTFFALTCFDYKKWGDFKPRFLDAWDLFVSSCPLTRGQRIGLRYKNVIDRKEIPGLEDVSWKELVQPFVAGIFAAEDFFEEQNIPENVVTNTVFQTQFNLEDCQMLLNTGLLHSSISGQKAFLIDSDCFHPAEFDLQKDFIAERMEKLHGNSGNVFQHSIKRTLHDALGPRKPEAGE